MRMSTQAESVAQASVRDLYALYQRTRAEREGEGPKGSHLSKMPTAFLLKLENGSILSDSSFSHCESVLTEGLPLSTTWRMAEPS